MPPNHGQSNDPDMSVGDFNALVRAVQEAINHGISNQMLSEEERIWVRLAIAREAQSIRLRQAIIEKTLTGLIWMVVLGVLGVSGGLIMDYLRAHGWKG